MGQILGATARDVVCVALLVVQSVAVAQTPASTFVAVNEQAARDHERVRILRDELAREERQAAEAAKRHAQHVATGDSSAARDAEAVQVRTAENIAALRREIAAASRTPNAPPHPAAAAHRAIAP